MGRRGDYNEEGSRTEADPLGSGVRSFSFTPSSPQITKHVADILARQDFILKLATAMMKFGAPSHRVDAQMQATARALDLTCQMVYLPGLMLISFGDPATHTSDTKVSWIKRDEIGGDHEADLAFVFYLGFAAVLEAGERTGAE